MARQHNQASKAEVQTTEMNKMPVANEEDTEFSAEPAEEAVKAFQQNRDTEAEEE